MLIKSRLLIFYLSLSLVSSCSVLLSIRTDHINNIYRDTARARERERERRRERAKRSIVVRHAVNVRAKNNLVSYRFSASTHFKFSGRKEENG